MANLAAAILAVLAFVGLLLLQSNVPWGNEGDGDGTVRTWSEAESGGFLFSYSNTRGWYDGGWEDSDQNAVAQLQVAAPLLAAATVLVLVGAILAFGPNGYSGSIVALVGALLAAAATLLYYLGTLDLYNNDVSWQPGLTIALVASVLGLAGGLFGMASGNVRRAFA